MNFLSNDQIYFLVREPEFSTVNYLAINYMYSFNSSVTAVFLVISLSAYFMVAFSLFRGKSLLGDQSKSTVHTRRMKRTFLVSFSLNATFVTFYVIPKSVFSFSMCMKFFDLAGFSHLFINFFNFPDFSQIFIDFQIFFIFSRDFPL